MYQTSIEGIKNVLKECWRIYTLDRQYNDKNLTWFHKLAALKLAKECNEALTWPYIQMANNLSKAQKQMARNSMHPSKVAKVIYKQLLQIILISDT